MKKTYISPRAELLLFPSEDIMLISYASNLEIKIEDSKSVNDLDIF